MTPDEQEALSRRHGPDVIILLPLCSGNIAVFNRAELCGYLERESNTTGDQIEEIKKLWHQPAPTWWSEPTTAKPRPTLDDLFKENGL